ncbi:hypothetical protein GIB67_018524 [Kingdonia uniflora]|uniref:Uncharacterized protein n=1 Tax=Kingdonia uniflora TaxID=39325 RepID=A0A7J7LW30_9MAGN|nr:hypothetical protein GIB67_018524 [Kingdonia uniflora]
MSNSSTSLLSPIGARPYTLASFSSISSSSSLSLEDRRVRILSYKRRGTQLDRYIRLLRVNNLFLLTLSNPYYHSRMFDSNPCHTVNTFRTPKG